MEISSDPTCFLSNGERKIMRVFITYLGERVCMDIPVGASVATMKKMVIRQFSVPQNNVQLGDEALVKNVLTLNYAGAELPDTWIMSDLAITPGCTIKAYIKAEVEPILYLYIRYKDETKAILEKLKLTNLSVSNLRSLASRKTGLPVSVFRLVAPNGREMYDCQDLDSYDITPGSVINIETWDGWGDLLKYSNSGFTEKVLEKINNDDEVLARYQMKVALYIAAHCGHSDMAASLCRKGIRPDEPVGLHPLRQWTSLSGPHVDTKKAPIHEAVECDQLDVLRNFALLNITSILAKDGNNLQPINIALRKKMKKCASFLLTKQWSRIPFNDSSIPLAIFYRLKLWSDKAKDKLCLKPGVERSTKNIVRSYPLVGQGVYIDGFSPDQMCSRSKMPMRPSQFDPFLETYYSVRYGFNPDAYYSNMSNNKYGSRGLARRLVNRSGYRLKQDRSRINSIISEEETDSSQTKGKTVKLPKIVFEDKVSLRSRNSSIQSTVAPFDKSTNPITQTPPIKLSTKNINKTKKSLAKESHQFMLRTKDESSFPLPLKSIDDTPRPHYYQIGMSDGVNEVGETLSNYYQSRGYSPRDHAIQCLSVSNLLKDKPWLSQVRIAMTVSREHVKKSLQNWDSGVKVE